MDNKLLKPEDFVEAAFTLKVDIETIKAVAEVEAAGNGFLADGRPKILFEAHIFSKYTKHQYDKSNPNISSKVWNRHLYKGGEKEYLRLLEATILDEDAALLSTSWGKFQIMGFNYEVCGYKNVFDFVDDMKKNEGYQLNAFVSLLINNNWARYLVMKDWTTFASYYNGPGYIYNHYDIKLSDAYYRLKKDGLNLK